MRVFISYEKLSKKEKRKIDLKSRGDWGGVKPIDTKHKNKKAYTRKKKHKATIY
jgi:hypothetical protein